ncbi:MAG: hypothetical protein EAZ97_16315 [Bacteroidetes bacterium]|nr:MAG: hypothetical protein EAZ97_16315 [Bacteroidota bacterium]
MGLMVKIQSFIQSKLTSGQIEDKFYQFLNRVFLNIYVLGFLFYLLSPILMPIFITIFVLERLNIMKTEESKNNTDNSSKIENGDDLLVYICIRGIDLLLSPFKRKEKNKI